MARNFNGSSDQINTTSFNMPAACTQCAWMKSATANDGLTYKCVVGQSTGAKFFQILQSATGAGTKFAYYITATAQVAVDPGTAVFGTAWNHVALAYDSTNGLRSYVNGVSDGTAAANGAVSGVSTGFNIGFDNGNAGRNFNGSIADAAEWSIALTSAEISALANGARPYTIRPLSLLAYLPLDGLQSPEPDLSGNANNGTLTGTAQSFGPPVMPFTPRWHRYNGLIVPTAGLKWIVDRRNKLGWMPPRKS